MQCPGPHRLLPRHSKIQGAPLPIVLIVEGSGSADKIGQLAEALNGIRDILDTDRPKRSSPNGDYSILRFDRDLVSVRRAERGLWLSPLDPSGSNRSRAQRILCRGGIARSKLILKHTPTILFGPATVDAYSQSPAENHSSQSLDTKGWRARKARWKLRKPSAGGGTRTRTELSLQRILSRSIDELST